MKPPAKSGAWKDRIRLPDDVRLDYQALYGRAWEEKFHRPADTPPDKAVAEHAEWAAQIKHRIAALRASKGGKGVDLSQRGADAWAGDWYRWFTSQHLDNPGSPKRWAGLRKTLWDMAYRIAGDIVDDVEGTSINVVDFDHPSMDILFKTYNDEGHRLIFGKTNDENTRIYIKRDDLDEIYVIRKSRYGSMNKPYDYFISKPWLS